METSELVSIINPNKKYIVNNECKGFGAKKKIFFATDNSFVVGIYKKDPDAMSKDRLNDLVGKYYKGLFDDEGGDFWRERFCWPYDIVKSPKGKIGIVMPLYPKDYFFQKGDRKGVEKKGKWFTSPLVRKTVDPTELGDWRSMLLCAFDLSRSIRRMHMAGLSHSDLSFNNVLLNPTKGKALIIDVDELVVPGKYAPGVKGTPGFIAPEVYVSNAKTSQLTDLHALACLVYQYLLHRDPLQGGKFHDEDTDKDVALAYGQEALFVEHSTDKSNTPKPEGYKPLDWSDVNKLPCEITGPYLTKLFRQAFEDGLHNQEKRPKAAEWESALFKTYERLTPCANPNCTEHYFVLNKEKRCPFCGQKIDGQIPVFDIYHKKHDNWEFVKKQLYGVSDKKLHKWHLYSDCYFSETLPDKDRQAIAYMKLYNGKWIFYNLSLSNLTIKDGQKEYILENGKPTLLTAGMEIVNNDNNGVMLKVKFI